jgi:ABC-type oligopeptide transport system substrate-binding subunit
MKPQFTRRTLLATGPLALTACRAAEGAYFGKTDPPNRQRLVAVLGVEPGSLDPATSAELIEERVIYALFEGLTTLHPDTGEAMAGLATHYEVTPDGCRYTFYLRGHPEPRGTRLPDRGDLPLEYSRGLATMRESSPPRWSDGVRLTADDFVYSLRRTLDPATGCVFAYLMHCIINAEEINSRRLRPERLAVRAIGDSIVQIDLRTPVPFFLEFAASKYFCPVPRHVVEAAGKTWTEPGRMVTSGAFMLGERRSGEKLVLTRNPFYYDASAVRLEELVFLPILATAASANLYRTAEAAMTPVTPTLIPILRRKKDYRSTPQFGVEWLNLRTTQAPFDDVRVRYALNMAIDKRAIADMRPGQRPAVTLVPPVKGYRPPAGVATRFGDSDLDVLSFNPRAARELLQSAVGRSPLRIRHTHPPFASMKISALILQQQWRQTLGIELDLFELDVATWVQATFDKRYPGIVSNGDAGPYLDPSYFLEEFTESGAGGSDWSNATYDALVADGGATADRELRLETLAQAEECLLRAMPVVPLSTFVAPSLAKPFVKGLGTNLLDRQQFKYVWIDTNWRPT